VRNEKVLQRVKEERNVVHKKDEGQMNLSRGAEELPSETR
jgi:hypothetical protein